MTDRTQPRSHPLGRFPDLRDGVPPASRGWLRAALGWLLGRR